MTIPSSVSVARRLATHRRRCRALLVSFAVFIGLALTTPVVALADVGRWSSRGPAGGELTALAQAPSNPSIVYAGGATGAFRSDDGGTTWRDVSGGFVAEGFGVMSLAVDPVSSNVVYAGLSNALGSEGFVVKSTDGGSSWTRLTFTGPSNVGPVASIVVTTTTILAGIRNRMEIGSVDATTGGGVFRSTDGGITRAPGGLLVGTVGPLVADLSTGTTFWTIASACRGLCSASTPASLHRSDDLGVTWSLLPLSISPSIGPFDLVAISPTTAYLSRPEGLFRTTDSGATWSPVPAAGANLTGVSVDPNTPQSIMVTTQDGPSHRSTDGGTTFVPVSGLNTLAPFVSRIQFGSPNRVWALQGRTAPFGTSFGARGGILRSDDAGGTWHRSETGLAATRITHLTVDPDNPETVFARTDDNELHRSADAGTSWTQVPHPLSGDGFAGALVHTGGQAPRIVAAGLLPPPGSVGPPSAGGLLISPDNGASWQKLSAPNSPYGSLAYDRSNGALYVGAFDVNPFQGVYRSPDGGATFAHVLGGRHVRALAVNPVHSNHLLASTLDGIFVSQDSGGSWAPSTVGTGSSPVTAFAFDAVDPNVIFALAPRAGFLSGPGGLWRSTDNGLTWSRLESAGDSATALVVDPAAPWTIYIGTPSGVLRSLDAGATWEPFNDGLTRRDVTSLVIDPRSRILYAGTLGGGVYALTIPEIDITVALSGPRTVVVGRNATFTATVSNTGAGRSGAVTLDQPLPPGMSLRSVRTTRGSCVPDRRRVRCALRDITSEAPARTTLVLRAGTAGRKSRSAVVAARRFERNVGNNNAKIAVTARDRTRPRVTHLRFTRTRSGYRLMFRLSEQATMRATIRCLSGGRSVVVRRLAPRRMRTGPHRLALGQLPARRCEIVLDVRDLARNRTVVRRPVRLAS